MHRDQRLRRKTDFQDVYKRGRVHGSPLLVLRILPNNGPVSRFGFVVGKTVGGAVVRNRLRRRLREAARMFDVRPGYDIVLNARRPAADAAFGPLRSAVGTLLARARVLEDAAAPDAKERS